MVKLNKINGFYSAIGNLEMIAFKQSSPSIILLLLLLYNFVSPKVKCKICLYVYVCVSLTKSNNQHFPLHKKTSAYYLPWTKFIQLTDNQIGLNVLSVFVILLVNNLNCCKGKKEAPFKEREKKRYQKGGKENEIFSLYFFCF